MSEQDTPLSDYHQTLPSLPASISQRSQEAPAYLSIPALLNRLSDQIRVLTDQQSAFTARVDQLEASARSHVPIPQFPPQQPPPVQIPSPFVPPTNPVPPAVISSQPLVPPSLPDTPPVVPPPVQTLPTLSTPVAQSQPSTGPEPSPAPVPPSFGALLTRQLTASVLTALEPLFGPFAPPDDIVLRANHWFILWLRPNLSLFLDLGLSIEEIVPLWSAPFARLIAVTASYRIPASWSSLEKLESKLTQLAQKSIIDLLTNINAFFVQGAQIVPLYTHFTAAVATLRTDHPYIAERKDRTPPSSPTWRLIPLSDSSTTPATPQDPNSPTVPPPSSSPSFQIVQGNARRTSLRRNRYKRT